MQTKNSALLVVLVGAVGFSAAYYFPDGPPHRPSRQAAPPPGTFPPEPKDLGAPPTPIPLDPARRQILEIPTFRQFPPEPKQELPGGPEKPEIPPVPKQEEITLVPRRRGPYGQARQNSCQMTYAFTQSGQTATLQSPNYPNEYPNNVQSTVCLTSPAGTQMSVNCPVFNLENERSCSYDYLGFGRDPNSISKYCGGGNGALRPAQVSGNTLAVVFKSDVSNPGASTRSPYRFSCDITVTGGSGGAPTTTTPATPPGGSSGNCTCGQRRDGSRIVGGTDAQVNEFPWRCYLKTNRYSFFCGCSIISNQWIMTAAHCTAAVMPLQSGDVLSVVVGDHVRGTSTDASSQEIAVAADGVKDHPQYNSDTQDYDMSLLRLVRPLTFSPTVSPLCLPWNYVADSFQGTTVTASGWGTTTEGGSVSNTLKEVDLPVKTTEECRTYMPGQITENMICTYLPGKDTCQGDSGGSIDLLRNGRYYGIGVVSWGHGCARQNYPGVYAKTTRFLTWIQATTNDNTFCRA